MAFLGIKVPHEVARLFRTLDVPGEQSSENEYHITILCFEDNWPISEVAKAMEATFDAVSDFDPLHIKMSQMTCFPKREGKKVPIIAKVECKELHSLNSALKKAFDKKEVEYSKTFNTYNPHMTLAFADDEIKDEKFDTIEFFAHEIVLWGGDNGDDRIFITFPLKSSDKKKHSYLLQKADVFYKLSTKNPNSFLRLPQSVEK